MIPNWLIVLGLLFSSHINHWHRSERYIDDRELILVKKRLVVDCDRVGVTFEYVVVDTTVPWWTWTRDLGGLACIRPGGGANSTPHHRLGLRRSFWSLKTTKKKCHANQKRKTNYFLKNLSLHFIFFVWFFKFSYTFLSIFACPLSFQAAPVLIYSPIWYQLVN